MDISSIVIMKKEEGILSEEIASYKIEEGLNLIFKIFVEDNMLNLFLTIDKEEVSDEEYDNIYDEYDFDYFEKNEYEIEEIDGYYNPIWRVKTPFLEDQDMESIINEILNYHVKELNRIYSM